MNMSIFTVDFNLNMNICEYEYEYEYIVIHRSIFWDAPPPGNSGDMDPVLKM